MFCIYCGAEMPDEAAFCWKCGKNAYKPGKSAARDKSVPYHSHASSVTGDWVNPYRRKLDEREMLLINKIVDFVKSVDHPVTAQEINDKFVHSEKTNHASFLLGRACDEGLISRGKVRKNANYEYAPITFDWDAYITEYDEKMAIKAQERIERARGNSRN